MFNKRLNMILLMVAILILAAVSIVFASGRFPWTSGSSTVAKEINNLNGIAPEKGKSGCVNLTATKGTFGTYTSVAGYTGYEANVVTAAGAAEPVIWELDGVPVKAGPEFAFTNSRGTAYSRAVQRIYSAASRTLKSCVRRQ